MNKKKEFAICILFIGHIGFVELMLRNRAATNAVDGDGKNVLHRACQGQHYNVCKLVLQHNTNILNVTDNRGNYPKDYVNSDNLQLLELLNQYVNK